jgi:hypothetical protein
MARSLDALNSPRLVLRERGNRGQAAGLLVAAVAVTAITTG